MGNCIKCIVDCDGTSINCCPHITEDENLNEIKELQAKLAKKDAELTPLQNELDSKKNQHAAEMAEKDAELNNKLESKENQHAAEMAQKDAEFKEELESKENQHAAEMAQKDAELTNELEAKENQHAAEMAQKDAELKNELESKENQHAAEMAQKDAEFKEELEAKENQHAAEMAQKDAEFIEELESKENQHAAEMAQKDAKFKEELEAKENQHAAEMAQKVSEFEELEAKDNRPKANNDDDEESEEEVTDERTRGPGTAKYDEDNAKLWALIREACRNYRRGLPDTINDVTNNHQLTQELRRIHIEEATRLRKILDKKDEMPNKHLRSYIRKLQEELDRRTKATNGLKPKSTPSKKK